MGHDKPKLSKTPMIPAIFAGQGGPFVAEIRKRLDSYFEVTVRNIRDSVPKAIGVSLVRAVQDKLQFALLSELNKPDKLSEMLGEPPHIVEERRTLHNQLQLGVWLQGEALLRP